MFSNVQYNNGVNAQGYGVFAISGKGNIHAEVAQEKRTVERLIRTTGGAVGWFDLPENMRYVRKSNSKRRGWM